jgi:lambda family phage portal protein
MIKRFLNWLRELVLDRYEGARTSTERSWIPATVQSMRFDASPSVRSELVRKSRYFERNSDLMNRLADIFEAYTVGTGLNVSSASSDPAWNQKAQVWWDTWCRFPDQNSRQEFGTLQGLMARSWFVDGEVFVLFTQDAAAGGKRIPRLQLVESHLVRTPDSMMDSPTLFDGIVLSKAKGYRPEKYYVHEDSERGQAVNPKAVDAASVVHVYEPNRPQQFRGIPFISPVLNILHDFDDLHIEEMRAAKEASQWSTFITTESGELPAAGIRRSRMTGTTQTSNGTATTENRTDFYKDIIGGKTVALRKGEDVKQFKPERPSVVTQEYWDLLIKRICAGVGIPSVLVFPESMQGTVYRGAISMAETYFRARSSVISAAVRRIYEHVMLWAIQNDPALAGAPADWFRVAILPPRGINVDVGRNSNAMLAELAAGATTYDQIYAPLGLDWREQFRRLSEQQTYARDLGLQLGSTQQVAEPIPADDEEDDADPPKKKDKE